MLAQGQCYIQLYFHTKFLQSYKDGIFLAGINNPEGLILLEVARYLLKHDVSRVGIFWLDYFSLENKSWKHKIEKVINLCVGKNGL